MPRLLLSIVFLLATMVAHGQNTVAGEVIRIDASSATVHMWFQHIERQAKVTLSYNPALIDLQQKVSINTSGKIKVSQLLDIVLAEYDYNLVPLANRKLLIQIKGKKNPPELKHETPIEDFILSIDTQPATVEQWFNLIKQQGRIVLSYPSKQIDLTRTVKFQRYGKITVKQLIATLLKDYEYKLIAGADRHLKIDIQKAKSVFLTGVVEEEGTGEKLLGATVKIVDEQGVKAITATDKNGVFCLMLNKGINQLVVSYMGYSSYEQTLDMQDNTRKTITLKAIPYQIKTVQIQRRKSKEEMSDVAPSNMLSFSNSDLFSQIQILPSVSLASANTGYNVAGGGTDENLTLLEGFPLYSPNHLNTLLPIFNGDAIKSVSFYNGYIPTQYEGRLSSVMDVKLRNGNKSKFEHTASFDVTAASAVSEGPIVKNKLSYLVGARRSWLDLFDKYFNSNKYSTHIFNDFNAKLSWDLDSVTMLKLSVYNSNDQYKEPNNEYKNAVLKWNTQLYTLQFNTIINRRLTNSSAIAYSYNSSSADAKAFILRADKSVTSGSKHFYANTEFTYQLSQNYKMDWGLKTNLEQYELAGFGKGLYNVKEPIKQLSAFFDNRISFTKWLYAQAGLHYVLYAPKHYRNYQSLQPRLTVKAIAGNKNLFYLTFLRMEQYFHHVLVSNISAPFDFIMPSIKGFKPLTATHYEVGWKYYLPAGIIELSAYYKRRNNLLALRPNSFIEDSQWDKYMMVGNGESYGINIYMYNRWRRFNWQLSYGFSKSREWYAELPQLGKIPSLFDLPHEVNAFVSYDFCKHSTFTVGGTVYSGKFPYDSFYGDENNKLETFRTQREPTRHRIDASYAFRKEFKNSKLFLRFGLYNLIGNPSKKELSFNFSYKLNGGCIPFGAITYKF